MFTWICPKCGGEVPPSYNECPRCTGQTGAAGPKPGAAAPPPPVAHTPAPPPVQQAAPPARPPVPPVVEPAYRPPAAAPLPPVTPYVPPPAPEVRARTFPPALVAILAGIGIIGLLAILYVWVLPHKTGPAAAGKAAAPLQNANQTAPPQSSHPLAKHLEVTGVRVAEGAGGTARIQFLVVNHSAADLPELKMEVTLRAADRSFFTFPADLPSIGPYEYKELTTTVKTDLKPYELPDWQMFRPEFRLTSQP